MAVPLVQKIRLGAYIGSRLLAGVERFPLVLMLEPTFRCNLTCPGCGKIDHPEEVLERRLTVGECLAAAEECGAPVVSIPGGEPLLHPEIDRIVAGLVARRRFVYLCTNALLAAERLDQFEPSPYLTFNIHLDGLAERHDRLTGRSGMFQWAVQAIRLMLSRGFRVTTNTTVFEGETAVDLSAFFDFLTGLGVEGMTIAPGFNYGKETGQEMFAGRRKSERLFREVFALGQGKRWRFNHSGGYLDFLAGRRQFACSPWGSPTRNVYGWQRPCYLLDDGFVPTYRALFDESAWDRYGPGRDPRCAACMMHCGFEPTAVMELARRPWRSFRPQPPEPVPQPADPAAALSRSAAADPDGATGRNCRGDEWN